MNLFSIFDPSTSMNFSFNWISMIYVILLIPSMYWLVPSRWNFFLVYFLQTLISEFSLLLTIKNNLFNMLIFMSLFMMIFFNNFMGMFCYIFVASSHLAFSLSLSLTLWLSFMLFGWIKNSNHMFIHLVPQGTPDALAMFMVLIETVSNLMRFGSLAVRLSANMVAGHLLMSLLSSMTSQGFLATIFVVLSQCILLGLELSVTLIQAYVFTVLIILYSNDSV
uniref:ATP synthase subunit a n=1 Tax=Eupristina koningsbergeri TaxID=318089 RepID=A0A8A3YD14_9HYME|nr:ATP synthase F0 subunit 6 [Eupristina koningsbergeri]